MCCEGFGRASSVQACGKRVQGLGFRAYRVYTAGLIKGLEGLEGLGFRAVDKPTSCGLMTRNVKPLNPKP